MFSSFDWIFFSRPQSSTCTHLQYLPIYLNPASVPGGWSKTRFARYYTLPGASKHVFPSRAARKPQEIPSMEPFLHHQPASQPGHYIYPSANSLRQKMPLRNRYSEFLKQNSIILKWKSKFLKKNSKFVSPCNCKDHLCQFSPKVHFNKEKLVYRLTREKTGWNKLSQRQNLEKN